MKEKVILKCADVSKYPDYVIECHVISYDDFRKYIAATPQEDIV